MMDKSKEIFVEEDENGIIITDERIGTYDLYKELDNAQQKEVEPKKIVMVHTTDFFPKDHRILTNFDGNKIETENLTYNGVTKECQALSHRHTAHFALNRKAESTGDGRGNWDDAKYIIIEPYDIHREQFAIFNAADSWTVGSVELSDKAIIMVREKDFDEIPEEEKEKYNIIRFRGKPSECLRNFLISENLPIFHGSNATACHKNSVYMKIENVLKARDCAINYVKNNSYLSRDSIELSRDDLYMIYDIVMENARISRAVGTFHINFQLCNNLVKEKGIPLEAIAFFINTGIVPTNDGNYTLKTEKEMIEMMCSMKNIETSADFEEFISGIGISMEDIQQFYDFYVERKYENLEEFINQEKELYRENGYIDTDVDELGEKIFGRIVRAKVLSKKMDDFEIDDNFEYKNATEEEIKIYNNLRTEMNAIIKAKGIEIHTFTFPQEKEDETVAEYIERVEEYVAQLVRDNAENAEEKSVDSDEKIETIGKTDFEKVASSKEAVVELQSGETAKEIREEITHENIHENTEEKKEDGEEHD